MAGTENPHDRAPFVHVGVSWTRSAPELRVLDELAICSSCMRAHRVELISHYEASNGRRVLLVFRAPDTEAVRAIVARLGLTDDDRVEVWTARAP